jgi:hypothetical protein
MIDAIALAHCLVVIACLKFLLASVFHFAGESFIRKHNKIDPQG